MQNWILVILFATMFVNSTELKAQYAKHDTTHSKFFIGSTLFMLANLVPDDNPPNFVQLNFGYRLSPKDALSLELKTWTYRWSLGIPYGPSQEAPEEKFPGYIREHGLALAYQHFWWKGLYTGVHVMNAWQTFKDDNGKKSIPVFKSSIPTGLDITSNFLKIDFLLSLLLRLLIVLIIAKCRSRLNSWTISGRNFLLENRGFILASIFRASDFEFIV